MKNLIIFLSLVVVLVGCQTKEEKAEQKRRRAASAKFERENIRVVCPFTMIIYEYFPLTDLPKFSGYTCGSCGRGHSWQEGVNAYRSWKGQQDADSRARQQATAARNKKLGEFGAQITTAIGVAL